MQPEISQSETIYLHTEENMRSKQIRRCSQPATYSCLIKQNFKRSSIKMASNNSPEKSDPKPSTIIYTSTQSGNVNLNVVLNRVPSQPPSLSSDSDIEVIPPEKLQPRANASKKFNTIILSWSIPGLSYPFVNNEMRVYSIVPTDCKIVKKLEFPEILNLKLVEANLEEDPILKTIRYALRDRNPRAKEIVTRLGQYYAQHYNDFSVRENCL